jgi:hypothetical protein
MFQILDPLHSVCSAVVSEARLLISPFFCTAGLRDARCDHNDNRSHADAPLSSKFCLLRRVRPFTFIVFPAQYGLCRFRVHESAQLSDIAFTVTKTRQTDATSSVPNRVEVTMQNAFGQHPTGSTSGDSTTIFGESEQILISFVICQS